MCLYKLISELLVHLCISIPAFTSFADIFRRSKSVDNPTNHLSQGEGPFRLTEYKHVNKPHPLGIRKNFKPNQQPIHGGEFQDKTTQRCVVISTML
ncbi:hypothetical protein DPMN_107550 [Dreissena polymorpha]|uniref:Secreted protein n=1 Tax=Dreissena polymorpha TaxID=45954 RepID=A0A9D4K6X5_DREPO|nr:hypothetical protein DPMN_107550 [Dreissena polymorpha]